MRYRTWYVTLKHDIKTIIIPLIKIDSDKSIINFRYLGKLDHHHDSLRLKLANKISTHLSILA